MNSSSTILNEIAADNLSGASAIYRKAITYYSAFLQENPDLSSADLIDRLLNAGRELIETQPDMAPLHNLVASVIEFAKTETKSENLHSRMSELLSSLADEEKSAVTNAAEKAAGLIDPGSVILTISYSSVVREMILHHPDTESLRIIVPESRPMCEGTRLAEDIAESGADIVLISDLAFGSYVDDIDYFVCGADAVTEKYLVNKVGTRIMSAAVKDAGGEAIAVFSEIKMVSRAGYVFSPAFHPAHELTRDSHPKYRVENRYFEAVPIENFSTFVTDRSIYVAETLREFISQHRPPFDAE